MLISFFDVDGIICKEFVSAGQTVNVKLCCDFWGCSGRTWGGRGQTNCVRHSWVLHHDKTSAHTALAVQQFLASKNMTVPPQLPYSLDLASCDFFLFSKIKMKYKGWIFGTVEDIQTESQKVLKTLAQKDFRWASGLVRNVGVFECVHFFSDPFLGTFG
jgi:hypothetical protein